MRLRATLAAAALLGAVGIAVTAPVASAYCDPDYYPLCTNDCKMQGINSFEPTVKWVREQLEPRMCPA